MYEGNPVPIKVTEYFAIVSSMGEISHKRGHIHKLSLIALQSHTIESAEL